MKARLRIRCFCAVVLALFCVAGGAPSADEIAVLCNITAVVPQTCTNCSVGCDVVCGTTTITKCNTAQTAITKMYLHYNELTALPESIFSLQQLTVLYLSFNQLTSLPESFGSLQQLTTLSVSNNELTALPESIFSLQQLTVLYLHKNQLTALPDSIGSLQQLTSLFVHTNQLTALPESIGSLVSLTLVELYGNCLNCSELGFAPDAIRNACVQNEQNGTCTVPEQSSSSSTASCSSSPFLESSSSSSPAFTSHLVASSGAQSSYLESSFASGVLHIASSSSTPSGGGNALAIALGVGIPVLAIIISTSVFLGVFARSRSSDSKKHAVEMGEASITPTVTPFQSTSAPVTGRVVRFAAEADESLIFKGSLGFKPEYAPPPSCRDAVLASEKFLLPRVPLLREIVEECEQASTSVASSPAAKALITQHGLTSDEVFALVLYTYDICTRGETSENFYFQFNSILRTRLQEGLAAIQGFMWFASSALRKLPDFEGIVFRGNNSPDIVAREYTIGREIFWSGFTSTTVDLSVARQFAGSSGVVFRIKINSGKVISAFSVIGNEKEVLLPPNSCLVVSKPIHTKTDGMQYVNLVEKADKFRW